METIELNKLKRKPTESKKNPGKGFDFLNQEISFAGSSFSDKKKEAFYSELHILLSSGVDLKTALEIIVDQEEKQKHQIIFKNILDRVISGSTLSDSIKESEKFSLYEYHSLKIGEESGRLNEILKELSHFYSRKVHQKRQMVGALSYPVMVLLVAVGAVFFMLRFVVPMFSDMFKTFKTDLPLITQKIISWSHFIRENSVLIFLGIVLLSAGIYSQRKKSWFRRSFSAVVLKLPLLGPMTEKIYLARFCQAMKLLTGSKTPLIKSLELVEKMIDFYPIEYALPLIRKKVLQGELLHYSMSEFPIFNRRMISLIKVAEEVNKMDEVFDRLSQQYTQEVEHRSAVMSKLIEPVMMVLIGAIVGTILVAMYLPLFQLSSGVR